MNRRNGIAMLAFNFLFALVVPAVGAAPAGDEADVLRQVAALDTEYQAAVEKNDWKTMDRILHPDMILVTGAGKTITKAQLVDSARTPLVDYEKQVEMPGTQVVRRFGPDTAVVTALLWIKGVRRADKTPIDYTLWFSDTYVRTPEGWRYAFGQASLRLPPS